MSVENSSASSNPNVIDKPSPDPPVVDKGSPVEKQPPSPTAATAASSPPEDKDESEDQEETEATPPDEVIDMETFKQILDLDEDDTHDFSREMVEAYYKQAGQTFIDMDEALEAKNLAALSSLGHFLKGSSATLGVSKVQHSCEKIQHYGKMRDEEAGVELTKEQALDMISELMGQVKGEYDAAERWMRQWYKEHSDEGA